MRYKEISITWSFFYDLFWFLMFSLGFDQCSLTNLHITVLNNYWDTLLGTFQPFLKQQTWKPIFKQYTQNLWLFLQNQTPTSKQLYSNETLSNHHTHPSKLKQDRLSTTSDPWNKVYRREKNRFIIFWVLEKENFKTQWHRSDSSAYAIKARGSTAKHKQKEHYSTLERQVKVKLVI